MRGLFKGKDQDVHRVCMIIKNKIWECPVQLVCPLESKWQMSSEELNRRIQSLTKDAVKTAKLDNSDERKPRQAGEMAKSKIKEVSVSEERF